MVGDGGRPLSAGERQRSRWRARSCATRPLVVLDEPTANLDPASAELVAEAVEQLREGARVLVIAHRPELARRADRVGHARGGRIVAGRRRRPREETLRRVLASQGCRGARRRCRSSSVRSAVGFGVALMATAGYLISRAAERPPILSLTVAIVAVRFFGLARPLARYLDRLVSHDLALRALGRLRAQRLRAPRAARARRARRATGTASCWRGWSATSIRCRACTSAGSGRRSSLSLAGGACVGVMAASSRSPPSCSPPGCSPAGSSCRRSRWRWAGAPAARRAAARAELTAELVELLRGAPELAAFGRQGEALARVRAADRELVRLGRRDAFAAGLGDGLIGRWWRGRRPPACSRSRSPAHDAGTLDRVLVATLALLALAVVRGGRTASRRRARAMGERCRRPSHPRADRPRAHGREPSDPIARPPAAGCRAGGRDRALQRR